MHFSAKLATFIEVCKLLGTYHHTEICFQFIEERYAFFPK